MSTCLVLLIASPLVSQHSYVPASSRPALSTMTWQHWACQIKHITKLSNFILFFWPGPHWPLWHQWASDLPLSSRQDLQFQCCPWEETVTFSIRTSISQILSKFPCCPSVMITWTSWLMVVLPADQSQLLPLHNRVNLKGAWRSAKNVNKL